MPQFLVLMYLFIYSRIALNSTVVISQH